MASRKSCKVSAFKEFTIQFRRKGIRGVVGKEMRPPLSGGGGGGHSLRRRVTLLSPPLHPPQVLPFQLLENSTEHSKLRGNSPVLSHI